MNKKIVFGLVIVTGILVIGVTNYVTLPIVETIAARNDSISQRVEETGYVRSSEFYDIQAPAGGKVIQINVVNGQDVRAGQVLMVIQNLITETQLATVSKNISAAVADRENAKAIIRIAQTDYEESQRELKRQKSLLDVGAISQIDYDTAQNNLNKAKETIASLKASMDGAEHRLGSVQSQQRGLSSQVKQLMITSPVNAKVLSLPIKTGQIVTAGTPLTTVGTPGRLEIYSEILSDDIVEVRPGQKVEVWFAGSKERPHSGRVKEVYPQAFEKISALGVAQRRVPVVVTLDENGQLKPGYEVKIGISTASRDNAILVPREAIAKGPDGGEVIRVIRSGRIVSRKIVTGLRDQFQIEILKGVNPGEMVIRDGSSRLPEGARVRIRKA